jgi:hypothetical protein
LGQVIDLCSIENAGHGYHETSTKLIYKGSGKSIESSSTVKVSVVTWGRAVELESTSSPESSDIY